MVEACCSMPQHSNFSQGPLVLDRIFLHRFQSIVDAEKKKEEEKNADEQEREGENEASNAEQENGVRNEEESMDKKDEE